MTSKTASVFSVKRRVLAASVEVSPITDNQIEMTSEDQHPGQAASEKSASLSTTSIKVSQPYPANSANSAKPSSVSEVPNLVTSRALTQPKRRRRRRRRRWFKFNLDFLAASMHPWKHPHDETFSNCQKSTYLTSQILRVTNAIPPWPSLPLPIQDQSWFQSSLNQCLPIWPGHSHVSSSAGDNGATTMATPATAVAADAAIDQD